LACLFSAGVDNDYRVSRIGRSLQPNPKPRGGRALTSSLTFSRRTAFGAIAAVAAAFSAASASAEQVKFGMITPLTGASSVVGLDMQRGAQLAMKRVNAGYDVQQKDGAPVKIGPGLLGGPADLIVEDDESRPASAMDAVRKLVDTDKVKVVIGEYSSGRTMPTGQFTNENKVIQISTGANSPALRNIGPYFFSAIGLATAEGPAMVELAQKLLGAKKIATMLPNNPYGVGVEVATCDAAAKMGAECVAKVRYEEQKTDYKAELRQLSAPGPDAVIFFAYGADATLILRQAFELGLDAGKKWIGAEVSSWEHDVSEAPQIADGIRGIEHAVGGDFYEKEYVAAYKQAYGENPLTAFGAFAYDATMLAALAVQKAGKTDTDAVRAAMMDLSKTYKGLTGDLTFDKDGMRVSQGYGYFIFKDGKLQPFTP
jgi:branched-chain amino acid transport system substrate-binding protein